MSTAPEPAPIAPAEAPGPASTSTPHVVVVGGGIMGVSTCYYLKKLDPSMSVTLIESRGIASAASGHAAGFLAADWNDGSELAELSKLSFALHKALAADLLQDGVDVGYRAMDAVSLQAPRAAAGAAASVGALCPCWVAPGDTHYYEGRTLGTSENSLAQVHPRLFTEALWSRAAAAGANLVLGECIGIRRHRERSRVSSVLVALPPAADPATDQLPNEDREHATRDGDSLQVPCTAIVFALGPWTSKLADLGFTMGPAVTGQKAHHVVLRAVAPPVAVFMYYSAERKLPPAAHEPPATGYNDLDDHAGASVSGLDVTIVAAAGSMTPGSVSDEPHGVEWLVATPEVYPRPDGTVYVCGMTQRPRMPTGAGGATVPEPGQCETLCEIVRDCVPALREAADTPVSVGACHIPLSLDGKPVMGKIPGEANAYIVAGHGCWGILLGPASGLAMAHLILSGDECLNRCAPLPTLSPFSPTRIPPASDKS